MGISPKKHDFPYQTPWNFTNCPYECPLFFCAGQPFLHPFPIPPPPHRPSSPGPAACGDAPAPSDAWPGPPSCPRVEKRVRRDFSEKWLGDGWEMAGKCLGKWKIRSGIEGWHKGLANGDFGWQMVGKWLDQVVKEVLKMAGEWLTKVFRKHFRSWKRLEKGWLR